LPVRVGLSTGGSAFCSFEQNGSFLGPGINLSWSAGSDGFPAFTGNVPLVISGQSLNRPAGTNVNASLQISRTVAPFDEQTQAYLAGFSPENQPALYQSTFTFHDLIAAGANRPLGDNPFAITHQGRLTLQPVIYAPAP
jgi:hypothetical protein